MISEVFVSAETIALAKEKACKMLDVTEDKVEFEIRQFPSKKVLGMFGGKSAQIKATLKKSEAEKAVEFLKEIFFYMGLENLNVEIVSSNSEECELKIDGDGVRYILGHHGDTLDALQYIAGLAANEKNTTKPFCKVRLEAGDYREKRKKTLEALAQTLAQRAMSTGKKQSLEPMRAYERKIIHTFISTLDGVKSWSEGENSSRHIVVSPVRSDKKTIE